MATPDDKLLEYIDEALSKLSDKGLHGKLVDVCLALQGVIRQRQKAGTDYKGPKRDRAAYMRQYRAKHRHIGI